MTIENRKKLKKWVWKFKKILLIIFLFAISIYFLFFMFNKYYDNKINETVDENFDIIRIDEGKTPYRKMKSRTEEAYSILLSDGEYDFSSWNKTGEHRQLNISVMGEGTFNFGFMNLNDSSTDIFILGETDVLSSLTINIDIEMDGGNVNILIVGPGGTLNIDVSGNGIVTIKNSAESSGTIITVINGQSVALAPGQTYIWG